MVWEPIPHGQTDRQLHRQTEFYNIRYEISETFNDLMQRYGQNTSKIAQKWCFSPICDPPRFFSKNWALSLFYTYGALTSCKKLDKTNERSLRYLKTDTHTHGRTQGRTHGQGRLLRTPSGTK